MKRKPFASGIKRGTYPMADAPTSSKSNIAIANATGAASPSGTSCELRDRKIVLLLCVLAAIHVFVFSAAFPFFNNVDELMHFDLVFKYSQGEVPRKKEMISPGAADYVALMNCHAYLAIPAQFPGGRFPPPPWTLPTEQSRLNLAARSADWQTQENYEVSQSPLYYSLAAIWWHIGHWMHFDGGRLLYWLRFLNIPLIAALVWLSYATARMVFPENPFLRLGVPALLAFMPQTAFYSIGNDMLSALCFGITFFCLLQWLRSENPSLLQGAAMGLVFGSTYLAKGTNLPLLAVAAVAVLIKAWLDFRRKKFQVTIPALSAFVCCGALPVIGWTIWCQSNFGDLTGSKIKMEHFDWTTKPFNEWWQHPIFTPGGFWTYLSGQLGTFWQGEFEWLNQPMALFGTDNLYAVLTLLLLAATLPASLPRFSKTAPHNPALPLSMACFIAGLVFFGFLSVIYDFHNCPNPSREHPYFQAGRMILGALIPFLLLFVYGLERTLNHFGSAAKWIALAAMISAMLVLEIATDCPVFPNEYNWYHLP